MLRSAAALLVALLAPLSCGGPPPEPETPDAAPTRERTEAEDMSATAEIGSLDQYAVDDTFRATGDQVQKCWIRGLEQNELVAGDVEVVMEIDRSGHVTKIHMGKTTLGDRNVELCMMGVLRAREWPKPLGGKKGIARPTASFPLGEDVTKPVDWNREDVADVLESSDAASAIGECRADTSGKFTVTMYVDRDGSPISVGVAPPDGDAERQVDCLVEALSGLRFRSPGSWPAKVTFSL